MRISIFITSFCLFSLASFAQTGEPKEITPQVLQRIKAAVDKEAIIFKQSIQDEEVNKDELEFAVDTFKIEHIAIKRMDLDYSTQGINEAVKEVTAGYDKLMNKYYNKLINLLTSEDRKVLQTAQKSWLTFRDAERKLIS